LVDGEILAVDTDFRAFIAGHAIDIVFFIFFCGRVFFISKASLRIKFIGSLLLLCVFYIGRALTAQVAVPDTSIYLYVATAIGIRLIALKIIFTVIDWED
jgi:hypothetical protein